MNTEPVKIGKREGKPVYLYEPAPKPKGIKRGDCFTLKKDTQFNQESFKAGTAVEYVGHDTPEEAMPQIDYFLSFHRFIINNDNRKRILDWDDIIRTNPKKIKTR